MQQLVNTAADVDGYKDMEVSDHINASIKRPDVETIPHCQIGHQVQQLEKHTKAFEYLLQIAELHDQDHQLDNLGRPIQIDDCPIGKVSDREFVGRHQNGAVCRFYEVGHTAEELNNQKPASLMMHQIIASGCSNDEVKSFNTRGGADKMGYNIRHCSADSTQVQYNPSEMHAYVGHDQIVRNQDKGRSQLAKEELDIQDLGRNHTMKKLNERLDRPRDLQEPASCLVKDHETGCSGGRDQIFKWPDAAAVKRARLQKQLHGAAAGGNHRDREKMHSQEASDMCTSCDHRGEQHAGQLCFSGQDAGDNAGLAKRLWNREAGGQAIAGDSDVYNPTARQWGGAGNNDVVINTAADNGDRAVSVKQSSTTQHAWSRPQLAAAGKREHLIIRSPSRSMNRRYKLLADVLC